MRAGAAAIAMAVRYKQHQISINIPSRKAQNIILANKFNGGIFASRIIHVNHVMRHYTMHVARKTWYNQSTGYAHRAHPNSGAYA